MHPQTRPPQLRITLNGQDHEVRASTVAELVSQLGLSTVACAVELNRKVIPKSRHAGQALSDGDRVEVVTLVGGG